MRLDESLFEDKDEELSTDKVNGLLMDLFNKLGIDPKYASSFSGYNTIISYILFMAHSFLGESVEEFGNIKKLEELLRNGKLNEDGNMPKYHMVYTVDGVKSEQDISAVNVQKAEELIRKQYSGQSINFTSKQEIKDINENLEEDVEDPMAIKEDAVEESEKVPQTSEEVGLSNSIIQEINGEWETIQHYNDLISMMRIEGYDNMIDVISDIVAEENTHIGQLQKCLQMISPNVDKIDDGETEASEQLSEKECINCMDTSIVFDGDFIPDDDFGVDSGFEAYL